MSNELIDGKKKSASEALVNSLGGFPVGYGLGIIILPISTGWIEQDPYMAKLQNTQWEKDQSARIKKLENDLKQQKATIAKLEKRITALENRKTLKKTAKN